MTPNELACAKFFACNRINNIKGKLMKQKKLTILDWILSPIETYKEWRWRMYKKNFNTSKGYLHSSKYHREAKKI